MLENLIVELRGRGFETVETFARKSSQNNPSGPLELYLKHGFKIENDEDDFPLVWLKLWNITVKSNFLHFLLRFVAGWSD